MPRYVVKDIFGRQVEVEQATPPTREQMLQLLAQQQAPAAPDEGGLLDALATGGKAALELIGRPAEFVQGTIAGTLQGGLGEGLRRGARAAFESNLADSKIQENTANLLKEQGILEESPVLRAGLGFVGDVFTDPLALLGAPGMLRRGLIAGAGKVGGATGQTIARKATGVPIGEAFQSTVVPALSEGSRKLAATLPGVRKLQQFPDLIGIRGTNPALDAQQQLRASEARGRAAVDIGREQLEKLRASLSPAQEATARQLMSKALSNSDPAAAATIAADPKLAALAQELKNIQQAIDDRELFSKSLRQLYLPVELKKRAQEGIDKLSTKDLNALKSALKINDLSTLPPPLQKLGTSVLKALQAKDGTLLYDPALLNITKSKAGVKIEKMNTLINYVPGYLPAQGDVPASIFRAINPTIREGKERALSFAELEAAGAETDIFKIMERRMASNARAEESARLIDEMATTLGSSTPKPGFVQISPALKKEWENVPALSALKDTYFPAPVAEELGRVTVRLRDPETLEGIGRRGLKLFKAFATSLNLPTYAATNFLGNVLNMHLAGMDPVSLTKELATSTRAMTQFDDLVNTGRTGSRLFKISGMSDADVLKLARERGIVGRTSGFASEFTSPDKLTPTAEALMAGRLNPLNPENPLYNIIRGKQQQVIEDPAKLALFVHELRKGAAPDAAQMTVFKYLFNYGDLAPFERQSLAGSLFPFYTWTRKNVPLIFGSLATRPQRLNQQQRLKDLITAMGEDDPDAGTTPDTLLPSYLKRGDYVDLPSVGTNRVRGRLRMPLQDINVPFEAIGDPLGTVGGYLNPGPRAVVEWLKGETLRGQPIRYGFGAPTPLGELLGMAGTTPMGERVQSNQSRYLTGLVPVPSMLRPLVTEPRRGTTQPLAERLAYTALGLSPTEITPSVRQSALRERQRARSEQTAKRRQALRERNLREAEVTREANATQMQDVARVMRAGRP